MENFKLQYRNLEQKIEFEVYPECLKTKYSFKEATDACKLLGEGWRLPTRVELLLMYENKDEIKGFVNIKYWSSSEYGVTSAWIQNFTNGIQNLSDNGKYFNYYVRAVRSINH